MDLHSPTRPHHGTAESPPYDPLLPAVSSELRSTSSNQVAANPSPVALSTPTETPHDLFCLAREYERNGRTYDAAHLYLKASLNGHLNAMVCYAKHLSRSDQRHAFVWYRAAAERGDSRAWAELGQLLASGTYFEVNAVDAARCWKRAAQMGDSIGKCCLGLCYIRGYGVRQDPDKGLEIVTQVADVHNDVTAMRNLAWIYRKGTAVPKNLKEAEYWYNRAKTQEEKLIHLSSREPVLYGRSKSSRSAPRHKTRHEPPTTIAAAAATGTTGTTSSQQYSVEAAPDSSYQTSDIKVVESNKTVLDEKDVEDRLKAVAQDPSRHSLESLDSKPVSAGQTIEPTADLHTVRTDSAEPGTLASTITREQTIPNEDSAVLETSAVLDGDSLVKVTQTAPATSGSERYDDWNRRKDVDPQLGATVAEPSFVGRNETFQSGTVAADAFATSREELITVQETPILNTSKQEELLEASVPAPQQVSVQRVDESIISSRRAASPTNESTDDNFQTPGQSLEDEEIESPLKSSVVAAGALGAGAGATASAAAVLSRAEDDHDIGTSRDAAIDTVQHHRDSNHSGDLDYSQDTGAGFAERAEVVDKGEEEKYEEYEEVQEDGEESEDEEGHFGETDPFRSTTRAGAVAAVTATSPSAAEVKNNPEIAEAETAHPGLEGLAPGVKPQAMFFEAQAAKDEAERCKGPGENPSYSLNGVQPGTAQRRSADMEEFEKNDVIQASEAMPISRLDGSSNPIHGTSYSMSYSTARSSEIEPEGQVVRSRAFDYENQTVSTSELEKIVASYPENPMRTNSGILLYQFLVNVQGFAVASSEAYGILKNGNALPKVIVAMISQPEDYAIQEQGLHAFVRIMRATQGPTKETLITMSFGDCFRKVQGNSDAVVPKGTMGVNEDTSGAIQAITFAMRTHAELRRIQLSGCAALAEVAAISSPCRVLAYENGVVSLVLGCLRHRSTKAAATIHDVGARTVSAFCSGQENFVFKEAFANAGAVPELLNILRMWGHSEDERSELTTTVVKSTCVALRYIADGCAVASAQCVQSHAYHHLIRVMVLYREDVSVCTIVVSTLSTVTRNAGSFAEKGLLDAKPLREVLMTMQSHPGNALFIRKCLDFMDALASFDSMRDELVDEGGIPFAAKIIAQNSNDSLLLERACSVVEKLCRGNEKNQDMFGSSNGVRSLITLLKSQQALPGVAERAMMAIASVCTNNPDNRLEAMKSGAAEILTHVLNAFSAKNARVVAAAAFAVTALVTPKNPTTAQEFAEVKAPDYIVRAMKKHPDSVSVQENGSAAIAAFCDSDPRIISSLLKSGISSTLIIALQRFLDKQSAVVHIARAMRAITNEANPEGSYRFKTKLLTDRSNESSLPEIFHTALSYHKKNLPETTNVIISICAAINRLCMRSVTFKNEVGKDGIVEELKRLVERTADFHENKALQPVLATICTLVLDSEENKNRFHEVGGVEAILEVMQKWRSDTYVLEHCCAALRYSCNDHYGNCIEVKNHNGVRSITGVMTRHSQHVNVMTWCCWTLADLCKGDEDVQSSRQIIEGIRRVISAMSTFADNHRFLAGACEFLRAASLDHEGNQERIVRLGGRTAIVKALESHPGNSNLTEAGSYALIQIQDIVDPRTSIDGSTGRLNIVQRISREMRRSSSAKSKESGKGGGIISRKSFSLSRQKARKDEESHPLNETVAVENPATRPSRIGFPRRSKSRRKRKGRQEIEELPDEEGVQQTAEEGYDELPAPIEAGDSPTRQLD